MYLKIAGHPTPKERPRSKGGQRGVYQPITDYERKVTETAKLDGSRFDGAVSVSIHFFCFGSRGDVDNLIKSCLDGLTTADTWKDDKDVTALAAYIHKATTKEDEATLITVTAI